MNSLDVLSTAYSPSRIGSRVLNDSPLQQLIAIAQGTPPFCLLLVLLVPPFLYGCLQRPTRADIPIAIVACVITMLIIGTCAITRASSLGVLFSSAVCAVLTCVSFFSISTFVYALIHRAFRWLKENCPVATPPSAPEPSGDAPPERAGSPKRFTTLRWGLLSCGLILFGWLPYPIIFFPGTMCYDVAYQLAQLDGIVPFTTEHSVFATYLYGGIYRLGESIAGPNGGVFALALLQYLAMSAAFGFEMFLIARLGAPKWALVLFMAFFALAPAFGVSAQWCAKDALFTALFSVYVSLMVLCAKERTSFLESLLLMGALTVVGLLCALLRNNGIYVIELLATWASIGARHPLAYLDSMAHLTYGYLSVVAYPEYDNVIAFFTQIASDVFGYRYVMPDDLRSRAADLVGALQDLPGLGVLGQPGFFTWLVMLEIAYLVYARRPSEVVMLLPVGVMVLTVLAGPVNGSIRYFLPIMAMAPIMLWSVVGKGSMRYDIPSSPSNASN